MIKKLKNLIAGISLLSLLALPMLSPVAVHAQTDCLNNPDSGGIQSCLDSGSCVTDQAGCDSSTNASDRVKNIIKLIINIFSLIVGVIAVIMIIIGGLKYITSGGDSGNISGAKNTILYAIIGLVVVALAQVIVRFVLQKTTQP
jgi:Type IV secretion system pilin